MKESITRFRDRTEVTQESIAIDLGTNKSHVSNIQSGKREPSMKLFERAFQNIRDPQFLNDLLHESTGGYGTPTPSNQYFDDHRLSIKYRLKSEILEMKEAMQNHRLDKHPEYLSDEEKAQINLIVSETMDVAFEVNALLMKFAQDYPFIDLKRISNNRNLRYALEKRI